MRERAHLFSSVRSSTRTGRRAGASCPAPRNPRKGSYVYSWFHRFPPRRVMVAMRAACRETTRGSRPMLPRLSPHMLNPRKKTQYRDSIGSAFPAKKRPGALCAGRCIVPRQGTSSGLAPLAMEHPFAVDATIGVRAEIVRCACVGFAGSRAVGKAS